jgi:tRNA nucleotidyltransferase (CCA-adding enzyme)
MNSPIAMDVELRSKLNPALWRAIEIAIELVEDRGWQLYVVGGVVRDLILARDRKAADRFVTPDIDLLVDGFDLAGNKLNDRAGVELARSLQAVYPQTKLNLFGKFQTAALKWSQDDRELAGLELDIATARTETYPHPAANPIVAGSSIDRDLFRRDFTINALAIRLSAPDRGEIIDLDRGITDLDAKYLRVLHPASFIDDPTRIYRGARFATRLGFEFEPTTRSYITSAIDSGIYQQVLATHEKAPALQTRMRAELKYLFSEPTWYATIELLDRLDVLKCIHPNLKLSPTLQERFNYLQTWQIDRLSLIDNYPCWLLKLELLLTELTPAERDWVANNLQLSLDSNERLQAIDRLDLRDLNTRSKAQIVKLLRPYPVKLLILSTVIFDRQTAELIWQYLINWRNIKPILSGADLDALGYPKGARYKEILDRLLSATLEGEVQDRSTAIELVQKLFPLT